MGDARAVGAKIRMRLASQMPLGVKVATDILARKDIAEATPRRAALLGHDGVAVAVEFARRNGARIIAVTNHADSPLAKVVDVVPCSTAQNNPLLGENATARIAQLNLLDALFVAVAAQSDRAAADQNLARTMRAVQARRNL